MKNLIIVLLLVSGFLCMSVWDATGYRLRFNVSKLQDDTVSVDSGYTIGNGAGYIEIVWNTGDTGSTIIIDTPGIYIVSVKDVWNIKRNQNRDGTYDYIYQQKGYFIHGYNDGVSIDTIVMDTVIADFNFQEFRTINIIDNNGIVTPTVFRDTAWTDATKSYYTETHGLCNGFWSGKLDTIVVSPNSGHMPLSIGVSVMADRRSLLGSQMVKVGNFNKWRASY